MYNFDPYSVLLAISTNIPQRLKTAFVLQGHIYDYIHALSLMICLTSSVSFSWFHGKINKQEAYNLLMTGQSEFFF